MPIFGGKNDDPLSDFGYYGGSSSAAEEEAAARKKRRRVGLYAVGGVAALVFSMVWNPPTAKVHSFTEVSDYSVERDAGCVNSGEGCHGDESEYRDFNDYHPEATCSTCHEYTGVGCIPCHKPRERECASCHDGTVENVPDRVRISDPYPRGHYRETTHTAMATDMDQPVRTVADGKAKTACGDCHSRDLREAHTEVPEVADSEYGADIGCGECHNDKRNFGLEQVLGDWEVRSCEACHRESGGSAPMHDPEIASETTATSPAGCGATGPGCHDGGGLHALHPDKPARCTGSDATGEPGCHDLGRQAPKPKDAGCGDGSNGCHAKYLNDELGHEKDDELHSPSTSLLAADTSFHGVACGACHYAAPDGTSLIAEHERPTSQGAGDGCRGCHANSASVPVIAGDWPARASAAACDDCHGSAGLQATHAEDITAQHAATNSTGCSATGVGCHADGDLASVGPNGLHESCLRCHDLTPSDGNLAFAEEATSCGLGRACHAAPGEYDPATSVHDATGKARADGRDAKHRAGAGFSAASLADADTGLVAECADCHAAALGVEHARVRNPLATGESTLCIRCHSASAVTGGVAKGSWVARSASGSGACATCHGSSAIDERHDGIGARHAGAETAADGVTKAGACSDGSGCHTTTDVRTLHAEAGGCTTAGCHSATGDILGKGTRSCGGDTGSGGCHLGYGTPGGHAQLVGNHTGVELDGAGVASKGACATAGCHTTVRLQALHGGDTGCQTEGCHDTDAAPAARTCGGPAGGEACHAGFSAGQHFVSHDADLAGVVNGVAYGPGANTGCFGCHDSDLVATHTTTATAPIAGAGASSCRTCHDEPSDPGNGAFAGLPAVRDAVAMRDRRCVTCHASGTATQSDQAAASPHKRTSAEDLLDAGSVWADPFGEWKAAFESPMGGGHNVLPASLVGAPATRLFPLTSYAAPGRTFTWALVPNSGATAWLRTDAIGGAPATTAEEITHLTVTCEDCHSATDALVGPHGAAVPLRIDAAYSQTEYANPSRTRLESQFDPTSAERVVCMKCHSLEFGSVVGTNAPGGHPVHAQHARNDGFPAYHPGRYGQKCIDCHVRIPHAWKSPRLLIRTIESPGRSADEYPYVAREHDGLNGVRLRDFSTPEDMTRADCAVGGCHGFHDATNHPDPSDIPTATYWP